MTHGGDRGGITRRLLLALAGGGLGAVSLSAFAPAAAQTAPMATRPIPRSGERLPVVGLGTAVGINGTGGWPTDTPEYRAAMSAVVRTLLAGGGSLVDTASNPGGYGYAERMLGGVVAEGGLRSRVFIATKIEERYEVRPIVVQASLARLGVSKIDLLQVHSIESAAQDLAPLREWKAQGLIRYVGITADSNHYFGAVEAIMRREKPDFIQVNYSLNNREAEQRLLPTAAELGIAFLTERPFGGRSGSNLFRSVQGKQPPEWAREFDAATWGQFFLKYLLGNGAVTAVIPGTNKVEHMADNLGAGRGRFPDAAQRQRMVQYIEG